MNFKNIQPFQPVEDVGLDVRDFGSLEPDPKVREARRILKEAQAALFSDPVIARGLLERLGRVLGAAAGAGEPNAAPRGGLAPWQEQRLRERISANLCDPHPLSELAALVRLSTGHFTRAFRQSFGVSPHTFIIDQRVNAAKRMILESDAPLAEIALSCGMADQSHLTRHFTKHVGMSPAAWRRQQTALLMPLAA
jgi:AraC-like DNA-binding protein